MRTWVVGDVHGCYHELRQLIRLIEFRPGEDRLYFLGDLVNGGPHSLEVLQWAADHATNTVLGNHDVHLLAVAFGCRPERGKDTFAKLFAYPRADVLLQWLRQRPFVIDLGETLLTHAGISPCWSKDNTLKQAKDLHAYLQTPDAENHLGQLWGDQPAHWDECRESTAKLRYTLNVFTRMRIIHREGHLNNTFKSILADCPKDHFPWYAHPSRKRLKQRQSSTGEQHPRVIHGHWAALGFHSTNGVLGLDTGCVWGGSLSAYCLEENQLQQVHAKRISSTIA